jgi:ribonuclease P protein component
MNAAINHTAHLFPTYRISKTSEYKKLSKKAQSVTSKSLVVLFDIVPGSQDDLSDGMSVSFDLQEYRLINSKYLIRVGYTASGRIGNAVKRNKAKRLMKAAVAQAIPQFFTKEAQDADGLPEIVSIVLIARHALLSRDFDMIIRDLKYCLHNIIKTPVTS